MKKEGRESALVIVSQILILISIIMVIPPVLMVINTVAVKNPFLGGLPVMYIWYYIWFTVMIVFMIVTATKSRSWDGRAIEKKLTEFLKQGNEQEGN